MIDLHFQQVTKKNVLSNNKSIDLDLLNSKVTRNY